MSGRLPSMSVEAVTVVCPHCDRSYRIKIDAARLARVRTRAGCQRCGRSFDVASSIRPGAGAEPPAGTSSSPAAGQPPPPPWPSPSTRAALSPSPTTPTNASQASLPPLPSPSGPFPPQPSAILARQRPRPVVAEPVPTEDFDAGVSSEPSARVALSRQPTALGAMPDNLAAGWIDFIAAGVDVSPAVPSATIGLLVRLLLPAAR